MVGWPFRVGLVERRKAFVFVFFPVKLSYNIGGKDIHLSDTATDVHGNEPSGRDGLGGGAELDEDGPCL